MASDWNDNWPLIVRKENVLDPAGNKYGYVNPRAGTVTFARTGEGAMLTVAIGEIESITIPAERIAEIRTVAGEVHKAEGTPEGEPLTSEAYGSAVMLERSGDNVFDMRRIMEAIGIPERCHTDVLSGIERIDLRGIVDGGKLIRIGDEAVPFLREILVKNQSIMNGRIRISEKGILENLGHFARQREVNDFLDAIGRPTGEGAGTSATTYGFDILEACGGTVPDLDEERRSSYLSNALEALMLAVIQRQFEPVVVDICLLLMGPQGLGKSNFARMLGGMFVIEGRPAWFRSTEVGFKDPRKFMESVSGGVIAEMAEGKQLDDTKGIKAFFDKDYEQYRRAYRRDEEMLPIRAGIIITHNEDRPVLDDTGARRYLPVWYEGKGIRDPKEIGLEEWRGRWRRAWTIFEERRKAGIKDPWRESIARIGEDTLRAIQREAMASALYDDDIMSVLDGVKSGEKFRIKEMEDFLRGELWTRIDAMHVEDAIRRFKKDPERFRFRYGTQNFGGIERAKGYRKI
ncbi:MAG: hypothetical protein J5494_05260 [Candidatus Methanomethylophilaceae archaeon]|nr:hypothetical protein [Candidatus Methanomethylophilaceae archaeon]